MTPREIKDLLYQAAEASDPGLALKAAKEFFRQRLWTSTPHWQPSQPDGTEVELVAKKPGTCAICNREFGVGELIRWRSRVDCHAICWEAKFAIQT